MNPRAWLQVLFPPPRRPVGKGSVVALVLLVAAFGLACFLCSAMDLVLFASPNAFWLCLLVPWFWWMLVAGHSGLSGGRGWAALIVRLTLVGLFIVLLAQPRSVRKDEGLAVVYLVDMSASVNTSMSDAALSFVTRIADTKPQRDEAGLVVFGRDASVELPPGVSFPLDRAVNVQPDRDGTNLAKALSLAAAVLPQEKVGRIVLISDGAETEGNLVPLLDELKSRGIAVDVLPIDYDHQNEVWVERLELPRNVRMGETYEAAVVVSALGAGSGELVLKENGQIIFRDEVQYVPGKNRYVLPIYLRTAGFYEYEASIHPPSERDGWQRNNRAISYLHLKGEGKVLVVTDPGGDKRDWGSLVASMRRSERDVEVREAYEFPTEPLSLLPYDCIMFVNAPADTFAITQLQAVHDAVFHQGTGFIMVGGENSYGPGGFHRTAVEDMLPVSMDITQRKIMPKAALVIVLHTCEFPDGNTWAKRITKQAIKVLGDEDDVGALGYDYQGGDKWLFKLTPAREYNQLAVKINKAQIGDMPSFIPTMKMALTALKNSDASSKHMIIISDGDPQPPPPAMLQSYVDNKITLSTVAVFPHGNDVKALQVMAQATGGRFYFPQDAKKLPSIFIKEAKTLKRSMIQDKIEFVPQQYFPSPIVKGIDAMPILKGYVLTTPKSRSTTILEGPDEKEPDPLLSVWRYGVGKTAAFTSDLSPNWAAQWINWDKYDAFVKQLLTDVSRVNEKSDIRLHSHAVGNRGVIVAEDYATNARFLQMQARIIGPGGEAKTVTLEQVGPRRYEASVDLWGEGRYQVVGAAAGDGKTERLLSGFVIAYSREYLRFRSNPILLKEIADKTDGRILDEDITAEQLYGVDREARLTSKPIFDWFLILLACLIPLDVAMRRIHIDLQTIRNMLGLSKAVGPSDETFSALLRAKQSVSESLAQRRKAPQRMSEATYTQPSADEPSSEPSPKSDTQRAKPESAQQDSEESTQTTSRLLAAKRRRREEGQ